MQARHLSALVSVVKRGGRVRIDSRQVGVDDIFFALPGERFHGARFIGEALTRGASYAVVDGKAPSGYLVEIEGDLGGRIILVDDALATLQALARVYREELRIPILAITGTNGKTTTKELLRTVLSTRYRVAATEGNLNNEIGLPLSLLSIRAGDQIALVEMGASHPGDIRLLCEIAHPTHGLITSIGMAHLEGFGSLEGVLRSKRELFDYLLAHDGTVFLRTDDALLDSLDGSMHLGCKASRYSLAAYRAKATIGEDNRLSLGLFYHGRPIRVESRLFGLYNAINLVAALHVATFFNVPAEEAAKALEGYEPQNHRSQLLETGRNRILVDAYNANPTSMRLAIESFAATPPPKGRPADAGPLFRAMILGEMRELGESGPGQHREIVSLALSAADLCLFVGAGFKPYAPPGQWYESAEALATHLQGHPLVQAFILLKGSRGNRLESLLPYL